MTIQHKDITGTDAVHPNDFYQSGDPGAVGAGKTWTDTTTTPPIHKRRNAGNTGWDTVLDPTTFQLKSLLTTLGDVIYATGASAWARLAGNTTTTRKFLRQTGSGAASAAPVWDTLVAGDIPNIDASKITSGNFAAARVLGIEPGYYQSHVNGGGGLDIWYALGLTTTTGSATNPVTANTLYAAPFVAPGRGGTIDRLAFNVTGALAGNGRAGIYDATSDTNIYPNNLVLDGGGITTNTTGVKAATVSQAFTPGKLYWAVYLGDAAATVRVYSQSQGSHILGIDSNLGVNPARGITVSQAYGVLPATFPAGAATTINSAVPVVYVRFSA